MTAFKVGEVVFMATNVDIQFEITHVNYDHTYQIQVHNHESLKLKYDNISAEMLRLVCPD